MSRHAEAALHADEDKLREFRPGWNAVARRFASCAGFEEAFVGSIQTHGDSPTPIYRHAQEEALFGFFVAGLSTLESLGYALWFVAAALKPHRFPAATNEDLRKICLSVLKDKMLADFGADPLARALDALCSSSEFQSWKDIRNTLAHRSSPSRTIFMSNAGPAQAAVWNTPGGPITLDAAMARSRRAWLAASTGAAMLEMDRFMVRRFNV